MLGPFMSCSHPVRGGPLSLSLANLNVPHTYEPRCHFPVFPEQRCGALIAPCVKHRVAFTLLLCYCLFLYFPLEACKIPTDRNYLMFSELTAMLTQLQAGTWKIFIHQIHDCMSEQIRGLFGERVRRTIRFFFCTIKD